MWRSRCAYVAPSTREASITGLGSDDRPASTIRAISGVHSHTSISVTARKADVVEPRMSPV